MEKLKSLLIEAPILRVNNRDKNLAFYQKTLGFKVWHEENAYADLGGLDSSDVKLILEESPSMRTRKVKGTKKLNRMTVFVSQPDQVEALLARSIDYDVLYRGDKGWAFEATSPEGDRFLVHSELDLSSLEIVSDRPDFESRLEDFTYLSDFSIQQVSLNINAHSAQEEFYQSLFDDVTSLSFEQAEGQDLSVTSEETWDISGFNLRLPEGVSLLGLASRLEARGIPYFINKKATFLTFRDKSELDLFYRL